MPTNTTFTPDASDGVDTTIDSNDPFGLSTTYGTDDEMLVGVTPQARGADLRRRGIIEFDISSLTSAASITYAQLWLTTTGAGGASGNHDGHVYRITKQDLTEAATWNNSGGSAWTTAGGDWTTKSGVPFTAQQHTDLKIQGEQFISLCNDALVNRSGKLRLLIGIDADLNSGVSSDSLQKYYTSDASLSTNRPKLNIIYTLACVWTGAAGDGDLQTAGNWLNSAAPNANTEKISFPSGTADVTSGVLLCPLAKIFFGKNYTGKVGTSSSKITLRCLELHTAMSSGAFHVNIDSNVDTRVFISSSPRTADSFSLSGTVKRVNITGTKREIDIDADVKSAAVTGYGGKSSFVKFSHSDTLSTTDDEDNFGLHASGRATVHVVSSPRFTCAEGAKVRIDCEDGNDSLNPYVLSNSVLDYRGSGFSISQLGHTEYLIPEAPKGTVGKDAKLDLSYNDNNAASFGSAFDVVSGEAIIANQLDTLDVDSLVLVDSQLVVDPGTTLTPAARPD